MVVSTGTIVVKKTTTCGRKQSSSTGVTGLYLVTAKNFASLELKLEVVLAAEKATTQCPHSVACMCMQLHLQKSATLAAACKH